MGFIHFSHCSSPSGSSPAVLSRAHACQRGSDGAGAAISIAGPKIYHLWPKTAKGVKMGTPESSDSLSPFPVSSPGCRFPAQLHQPLQEFNFPGIQSRQNNVFNI